MFKYWVLVFLIREPIFGQNSTSLSLCVSLIVPWVCVSGYLYQLLAAVIKGNHTNCSQFANSHRLNWLFSRLGSAGEGTGMLDVLHCVLIDSPEALNVMKVRPRVGGASQRVA